MVDGGCEGLRAEHEFILWTDSGDEVVHAEHLEDCEESYEDEPKPRMLILAIYSHKTKD